MAKFYGKEGGKLRDALMPLRKYLEDWSNDQLDPLHPVEARRLLTMVQEIELELFEVEQTLADRAFEPLPKVAGSSFRADGVMASTSKR